MATTQAQLSEDTLGVFLFGYTDVLGDIAGIHSREQQGGFVIVTKSRKMWYARQFCGRARDEILLSNLIPSTMENLGSPYGRPLLPNDKGEKLSYLDGVFWGIMPFVQLGLNVPTPWANQLSDVQLNQAAEALADGHMAGLEIARTDQFERFLPIPPVVSNLPEYFGKFLRSLAIYAPRPFGDQPALQLVHDMFAHWNGDDVKPTPFKPCLVVKPRYIDDELKLAGMLWGRHPQNPVTPQELDKLLKRAVASITQEERRLDLPLMVVHGDVNRSSFLYDYYSGSNLGAIGGWSECHSGLPIYDLARAAVMLCVDWEDIKGECPFKAEQFELFFCAYKKRLSQGFLDVYGEAINSESLLYNYMLLVCYRLIAWGLEQKLTPYPELEKWREAKVVMVAFQLVHLLHGKLV